MAVQREYLSPNEVAELLGVSPFTIRRYIKLGELKAVKLLGGFRVHRDDLQRFLKAHEVNSGEEDLSDEALVEAPGPEPEALRVPAVREEAKPRRQLNNKSQRATAAASRRTKRERPDRKKARRPKA